MGVLVMMRIVCGTLATLLLVATNAAYADPEAQYLECIKNKNSETCQKALKQHDKEKKPEDILRNTYVSYIDDVGDSTVFAVPSMWVKNGGGKKKISLLWPQFPSMEGAQDLDKAINIYPSQISRGNCREFVRI